MNQKADAVRSEMRFARRTWVGIREAKLAELRNLVLRHELSVALGDVLFLDGHWYITHSGLLRFAHRSRCSGIKTSLITRLSDPVSSRWVFKATVYSSPRSRGFVGYGDADPSNVSPLVRGCELRIAETRAVNRALRKAYGIGVCSVEELGHLSSPPEAATRKASAPVHPNENSSGNGQPRLRDRLCLLIRQHQLDPNLVKRYAADFCGTPELRHARRDLVESFITHLADWAARDRVGLLCKLQSYAQSQEVHP